MADDEVMRSLVRDDAYRVVRVLADGPSGKTELVTLDGEGPLVRKRIPAALANPTAWATVMGLDEPLLPKVEELYRMPDELVVVCAYVPGDTVRELMAAQGHLEPEQATCVLRDLCHAAGVLHAHGLVHRDITPGNVVVAADGAHLIDLGIARQDVKEAARDTHVLGTWGFAAPEQFGFARTTARSDVYALGRMLGYLLTGILPSDEAYDGAIDDEGLVAPALAAVIRRATAFEPSVRYQQAGELAAAIDEALASQRAAEAKGEASGAQRGAQDEASRGPRPIGQAPLAERVAADVCWAVCVAWVVIIVAVGIDQVKLGFPDWQVFQYVFAAATIAAAVDFSHEVFCAVTHRGRYARGTGRMGSVLRRMVQDLIYLAALFALMVLVAVILE